jgi:hypothetical protein
MPFGHGALIFFVSDKCSDVVAKILRNIIEEPISTGFSEGNAFVMPVNAGVMDFSELRDVRKRGVSQLRKTAFRDTQLAARSCCD